MSKPSKDQPVLDGTVLFGIGVILVEILGWETTLYVGSVVGLLFSAAMMFEFLRSATPGSKRHNSALNPRRLS